MFGNSTHEDHDLGLPHSLVYSMIKTVSKPLESGVQVPKTLSWPASVYTCVRGGSSSFRQCSHTRDPRQQISNGPKFISCPSSFLQLFHYKQAETSRSSLCANVQTTHRHVQCGSCQPTNSPLQIFPTLWLAFPVMSGVSEAKACLASMPWTCSSIRLSVSL